ncbi:MAG: DUF1843 domain-containing protein [Aliidongia sp.]|jgi:hypothetical protein
MTVPQPAYGVASKQHFPLYAATLHSAVARNDRAELDSLICQAETYLETYGDLPTLIELLKTEIARLER